MRLNVLYNQDCLVGMRKLPADSVDAVVTDPPYGLRFMSKKWDYDVPSIEIWREILRVLKPGGHVLSFGGTRTYHRMVCALEDAGFEIRNQLCWLYGSGFPKSRDVSKDIDKASGLRPTPTGNFKRASIQRNGTGDTWAAGAFGSHPENTKRVEITAPATEAAKQWDGWGTGLKPAVEPIVLARKPLSEKTVAKNVLKWGTGALNVDGCRISHNDPEKRANRTVGKFSGNAYAKDEYSVNMNGGTLASANSLGRWPANVLLDEEAAEALDQQSGRSKSMVRRCEDHDEPGSTFSLGRSGLTPRGHSDSGGASRFFYVAKASKRERGDGNNHPTVKPIQLLRYLVRLITPPNGIVLDPFVGSGATPLACLAERFHYIGLERERKYVEIARRRIVKGRMDSKGKKPIGVVPLCAAA